MATSSTAPIPTATGLTSVVPSSSSSTLTSSSLSSTSSSISTTSSSTSSSSTSSSTSTSSSPTTSSTGSSSTSTEHTSSTTSSSTSSTSSTSTEPTTSLAPSTIISTITSTAVPTSTTASQTSSSTITSSTATASPTNTDVASSGSHGLSAGGTIALAVVVPVASVAIIIAVLLWWWRRRKANKLAEEERRKEVEEYGFNPNNDSGLGSSVAGRAVSNNYSERYESQDGNSGYRGWGTTSHPRNPSTNLSSIPLSETGAVQYNDGPLRPDSGEVAAMGGVAGAVGAGAGAGAGAGRGGDIHRGLSNASSAYSAGVHSEGSDDGHLGGPGPNQYYEEGNPYYNDVHNSQAGYGDPTAYGDPAAYGVGQPVIRDVQARRNTRIENPGVYPQQGNAGIAQNF